MYACVTHTFFTHLDTFYKVLTVPDALDGAVALVAGRTDAVMAGVVAPGLCDTALTIPCTHRARLCRQKKSIKQANICQAAPAPKFCFFFLKVLSSWTKELITYEETLRTAVHRKSSK